MGYRILKGLGFPKWGSHSVITPEDITIHPCFLWEIPRRVYLNPPPQTIPSSLRCPPRQILHRNIKICSSLWEAQLMREMYLHIREHGLNTSAFLWATTAQACGWKNLKTPPVRLLERLKGMGRLNPEPKIKKQLFAWSRWAAAVSARSPSRASAPVTVQLGAASSNQNCPTNVDGGKLAKRRGPAITVFPGT